MTLRLHFAGLHHLGTLLDAFEFQVHVMLLSEMGNSRH